MGGEAQQDPVVRSLSTQLMRPLEGADGDAARPSAHTLLRHFRDHLANGNGAAGGFSAIADTIAADQTPPVKAACRRMGELLDNLAPRLGADRAARVVEACLDALDEDALDEADAREAGGAGAGRDAVDPHRPVPGGAGAGGAGGSGAVGAVGGAPQGPALSGSLADERARRLREDDPRLSSSWTSIDAAQSTPRRATISGAFSAIDPTSPSGGSLRIESWPTSLDTWLANPPAPLAWTRDEEVESGTSVGPLLIRSAHSAPVAGMEVAGRTRRWLLWCYEGVLMELHVAPEGGIPDLADLLRDHKVLSPERARELREQAEGVSKRLFSLAFREPGMDPDVIGQLEDARRSTLLRALLQDSPTRIRGLGLEGGQPVDTPPPHSLLQQLRPMLEEGRKEEPTSLIRERMRKLGPRFPTFNAPRGTSLAGLGIRGREKILVEELLQGEHTLDRVVSMSPLNARKTLSLLHQLDHFGLITWMTRKRDDLWQEHAVRVLRKAILDWREADPFSVLGTHWSSYDTAVVEAHRRMRDRLLLERALASPDPTLRELAAKVSTLLDEALAAVATREKREQVREPMVDRSKRAVAAQLSADQAQLAEFQTDLERARDAWKRVLELFPGTANAEAALARLRP